MRRLALLSVAVLAFAGAPARAAQVRVDRPRLFLSDGSGPGITKDQYVARCTSDPAYMSRCMGSLGTDDSRFGAMAKAAQYVVTGDPAACAAAFAQAQAKAADDPGVKDAHSFISDNGTTMVSLAVTRDWCDPALTPEQLQWLEGRIVQYADWYLQNDPKDVYHDDMNNVYSAVALAGLALKHGAQDAKADAYLAAADAKWKQTIFPALAHVGDWWHEGMVYVQPSVGLLAVYLMAWSTATDEDLYAYVAKSANDLAAGYLRMHAYALRPDWRYVYFGDTSDPKQSIELHSRWLVDMLNLGPQSGLGQALSMAIREHSQPYYDYAGAEGWLMTLLYDASKDGAATPLEQLPTTAWLSQGAGDLAVLRSGWAADDTYVWISCGDYFGAHQHSEAGSFQIFRHALLTGATGYYDAFDSDHWQNYYSQHSVHANTLAIYRPGELFPTLLTLNDPAANVNDGGQRVLRMNEVGTKFPSTSLDVYLQNKQSGTKYETGDLTAIEAGECHRYVACDVTAAYSSPGFETNTNSAKVDEVTRQFVLLPPDLLVIFDRVSATDPSHDKRFLLHALAAPQIDGSEFTITNGPGRLVGRTVLPEGAQIVAVEDFTVEGKPHPPSVAGMESGGTRLEVSPAQEGARDYFLHVLRATDSGQSGLPPIAVQQDDAGATVTIDGARKYELRFTKTGEVGGHIKVEEGGAVICEQGLGEAPLPGTTGDGGTGTSDGGTGTSGGPAATTGEAPTSGATAGGTAASGGSSSAGADSATGGGAGAEGCACDQGEAPATTGLAALVLGALVRRRRARAAG